VGSGGHSEHFPIFFEVKKGPNNPPSPLKFNKCWLQEESFKNLFLSHWVPFGRDCDRSAALQFADNIKRLKVLIKEWAVAKRKRDEAELKFLEDALLLLYEGDGGGFLSAESKEILVRLEGKHNIILLEKEEAWRLKSRAVWLESGDDNTKFFHTYARGRKVANTIWSLQDEEGSSYVSFDEKARCGVTHFQQLFKAPA